jgi:hypothetical protein
MTERTPMIEDRHQEPISAGSQGNHSSGRAVTAKRRGRPRGTDYRRVDRPRHEEMRRLCESGEAPSLTAAAWKVVDRAYGGPSSEPQSRVTRLVRTYPFDR